MTRILLLLAALLMTRPVLAQDIMSLIRADRWSEADAAAAAMADPVARKLVVFYRLMAPGGAGTAEIGAFVADNPEWPLLPILVRRRDAAMVTEPDDRVVLAECDRPGATVALPDALMRCADAASRMGRADDAVGFARRAWQAGPADAAWEARAMQRWGGAITRAGQWSRFDRLAWTDTAAAARQLIRLDAADRPLGTARLALRRDDVSAPAIVAALPDSQRADPAIVLELAKWLRRAGQDDEALALWTASGAAAERAATADRHADFWNERNLLARRRLRQGDASGAYTLADGHALLRADLIADAEFLAGFVALEKLRDKPAAIRHFQALAAASRAAITQARAHYWIARATAGDAGAAGDAARDEYRRASSYPSTFYGQLAALQLDGGSAGLAARITAARDPAADPARGLAYAGRELTRAAAHVVAWGEPRRATPFLLRLQELTPEPADKALAGRLAGALGLAETEVALARRAGTAGMVPIETGWPLAADIPADAGVEAALALGVIRQESSFDAAAASPAGARGLMQLMPATAAAIARKLGLSGTPTGLAADPATNIRLGTSYLRALMDQYDNAVPLAVAAYNAGPRRVAEWIEANGDPRGGTVDPIDWIELIPFSETRNYVQRVIENQVIYRAARGDAAPHPLARSLR